MPFPRLGDGIFLCLIGLLFPDNPAGEDQEKGGQAEGKEKIYLEQRQPEKQSVPVNPPAHRLQEKTVAEK